MCGETYEATYRMTAVWLEVIGIVPLSVESINLCRGLLVSDRFMILSVLSDGLFLFSMIAAIFGSVVRYL
jgi:hypothetical protein